MLFTFLQKQKKLSNKTKLVETMIQSLEIPEEQKQLYLQCLDILSEKELNNLYKNLTIFVKEIEMEEIQDIQKQNFTTIAGMQKKEAEERKQEMNSFSFLLHNL
jgi:uncharacterized protein YecA (UPF0149 family)